MIFFGFLCDKNTFATENVGRFFVMLFSYMGDWIQKRFRAMQVVTFLELKLGLNFKN